MAERNFTPMYNLEELLNAGANVGPQMTLMKNPQTGEPGVLVKEPTSSEKSMSASLSPGGKYIPPQNAKAFITQQRPVSKEDLFDIENKFSKDDIKKLLTQQATATDSLEQIKQNYARQRGLDPQPMAAFLGTMMKNSQGFAEAFPKSKTSEEKMIDLAKLQKMVEEGRKNETDQAIDFIKTGMQKRALEIQAQNDRFSKRQDLTMFNIARKEQASLVKDAAEFRNQYFNAEDAIRPDEKGQIRAGRLNQALSSFARLMGEKGVLTDTDIGRQLSPTLAALQAKVATWATSDPNTLVDASVANSIRDALKTAKEAFKQKYEMQRSVFQNTYFNNPYSPYAGRGWSEQMVRELDKPLELINSAPEQTTPTMNIDQNAIEAEMKRRGLK